MKLFWTWDSASTAQKIGPDLDLWGAWGGNGKLLTDSATQKMQRNSDLAIMKQIAPGNIDRFPALNGGHGPQIIGELARVPGAMRVARDKS